MAESAPAPRTLLVFARAPVVGTVKTRLAATLGDEAATRIYRRMGRHVVDRVRGGPYRVALFYDPPGARAQLQEWLGTEGLLFHAQPRGDLGERMLSAFRWAFASGGAACIIGTDAPDIHSALVLRAFQALEGSNAPDAVFGPAADGGYYLLGLRGMVERLFEGIPWGTGRVLAESLRVAESVGLSVELLPTLADVDRPEDVPERFLR